MTWIEGLKESIGTELALIVTTPEYNNRKEKEHYNHHGWLWRKIKRNFRDPPKYPYKGKTGVILIPDMNFPNTICSLWGKVIEINYQDENEFDYPMVIEGIGDYGLIPKNITVMETPKIIRIEGTLIFNQNSTKEVNIYSTVESTRDANLHYILRDLDKFFK